MSDQKSDLGVLGGLSAAGGAAGAALAGALGIATLPVSAIGAGVVLVVFGIAKISKS